MSAVGLGLPQHNKTTCCSESRSPTRDRGDVTMKHILHLVCIALPLMCGAEIAVAFTPGVPPLSGPGSVFYGQPEKGGDPAIPTQKSQRKQKKSQQEAGFRSRQVLPKRSQ